MAKRDSTTEGDPHRNSDLQPTLRAIIECVRVRLLKAHSVLGCTGMALDNDDGSDRRHPDYAYVVDVVRDMIEETTVRLDLANLGRFY